MANTADMELSPIWRSLPFDLVQEILDRFTDDVTASCDYNDDLPNEQYNDPGFASQLYQHWQTFRQDSLFKFQRRRFEQHFRDRWLPNMTIYLKFDLPREKLLWHCRYLPLPYDIHTQKMYGILPGTSTVEEDGHRDPDSERVNFFLYGPILEEVANPVPGSGLEKELLGSRCNDSPYRVLLPTIASLAWETIIDNDGEAYAAVSLISLGVGLRTPGYQFLHGRSGDIFRSWSVGKKMAEFEVLEEGRGIRFSWKHVMSGLFEGLCNSQGEQNMDPP